MNDIWSLLRYLDEFGGAAFAEGFIAGARNYAKFKDDGDGDITDRAWRKSAIRREVWSGLQKKQPARPTPAAIAVDPSAGSTGKLTPRD